MRFAYPHTVAGYFQVLRPAILFGPLWVSGFSYDSGRLSPRGRAFSYPPVGFLSATPYYSNTSSSPRWCPAACVIATKKLIFLALDAVNLIIIITEHHLYWYELLGLLNVVTRGVLNTPSRVSMHPSGLELEQSWNSSRTVLLGGVSNLNRTRVALRTPMSSSAPPSH